MVKSVVVFVFSSGRDAVRLSWSQLDGKPMGAEGCHLRSQRWAGGVPAQFSFPSSHPASSSRRVMLPNVVCSVPSGSGLQAQLRKDILSPG